MTNEKEKRPSVKAGATKDQRKPSAKENRQLSSDSSGHSGPPSPGGSLPSSADDARGSSGGDGDGNPPSAPGATQSDDTPPAFQLTDLGNAQRLVHKYGAVLRYVPAWKGWNFWDGRRWQRDDTGEVHRCAKDTIRSIYTEVGQENDEDDRGRPVKHALRSESVARLKAMVELAGTEPGMPVRPEEFDSDPWLLNVLNGTVDLRKGELRPHRREDRITKLAPAKFDPDADMSDFQRFVEQALPDPDVRAFVQRAFGYAATGDTSEEALFFIHGPTRSMKSTFVEAVKATLGDYALTAGFDTFLQKRDGGSPRSDLARLPGARPVCAIEVDEGKRLAESLIKSLTGGDTVTVRRLYEAEFEFKATFKLFFVANDPPAMSGSDNALWERLWRIPFDQSLPVEDRDPAP